MINTRHSVTKVRVQPIDFPERHEHVSHIMLETKAVEPREQVGRLLQGGHIYRLGRRPLAVGMCPECFGPGQLLVSGTAKSLLALPRF